MSTQARPSHQRFVGHILVEAAPASMGDALAPLGAQLGEKLGALPLMPTLGLPVNDTDLTVGVAAQPITDRRLLSDLAISPLRERLTEPVARHQAVISVSLDPATAQVWEATTTWANVVAALLNRTDAVAVWLPYQERVTTDVLFQGQMRRPADNIVGTIAMWSDEARTTSFGTTRGLDLMGGRDLEVQMAVEPAALFRMLQDAVAAAWDRRRAPVAGDVITIGHTSHALHERPAITGDRTVLGATPTTSEASGRRWPFGRSRRQ